MQTESIKNIITVALGVCLVCSVLVAGAAVSLSSIQNQNKKNEKIKNILIAGGLYQKGVSVEKTYHEKVEAKLVDLETGDLIPDDMQTGLLDIESFDLKKVANDNKYGMRIPAKEDIARIKRRPKYMPVYFVKNGDQIEKIILPIYGKGLWSTLYGFIALDKDMKTIKGITFYEHGETPGLGGEVDNPRWKQIWDGKQAYDDDGAVIIQVIKGRVNPQKPEAIHQVDGLSGATLTTRGVDQMVKYWLGETGYETFLTKLKTEVANGK